jgi:hypothetical protein
MDTGRRGAGRWAVRTVAGLEPHNCTFQRCTKRSSQQAVAGTTVHSLDQVRLEAHASSLPPGCGLQRLSWVPHRSLKCWLLNFVLLLIVLRGIHPKPSGRDVNILDKVVPVNVEQVL